MRRLVLAALSTTLLSSVALAQPHPAGGHPTAVAQAATDPKFLEALRDLRSAQAGIKVRTDKTPVSPHEHAALNYVGTAIYELQRATAYKDNGATTADVQVQQGEGRLHDVAAYLGKARSDLDAIAASSKLKTDCLETIMNAQLEVGRALKDYATQPAAAKATNPEFLEALRDLRSAQAGIKNRTDKTPVSPHEHTAEGYIGTAIYIIQRDTGYKDNGATVADVQVHQGEGRLHDVAAYLGKARSDLDAISGTNKLKTDGLEEIMNAQLEVGRALKDYASPGEASKKR